MGVDINEEHNTAKWQNLFKVINSIKLVIVICPKLLLIKKLCTLFAN